MRAYAVPFSVVVTVASGAPVASVPSQEDGSFVAVHRPSKASVASVSSRGTTTVRGAVHTLACPALSTARTHTSWPPAPERFSVAVAFVTRVTDHAVAPGARWPTSTYAT